MRGWKSEGSRWVPPRSRGSDSTQAAGIRRLGAALLGDNLQAPPFFEKRGDPAPTHVYIPGDNTPPASARLGIRSGLSGFRGKRTSEIGGCPREYLSLGDSGVGALLLLEPNPATFLFKNTQPQPQSPGAHQPTNSSTQELPGIGQKPLNFLTVFWQHTHPVPHLPTRSGKPPPIQTGKVMQTGGK